MSSAKKKKKKSRHLSANGAYILNILEAIDRRDEIRQDLKRGYPAKLALSAMRKAGG